MPESVSMGQLHLSKACWELWLSDDQPHSDYNGQWQRALRMVAVLQSSQPIPQRNTKRKMYAIKQIKICAEYRDMLPRPQLDLLGTPGLRPFGVSPGSWQISLGLCSMSRYSAQILISMHKLCTGLLWGNPPVDSPHIEPVKRKDFPYPEVTCHWGLEWRHGLYPRKGRWTDKWSDCEIYQIYPLHSVMVV